MDTIEEYSEFSYYIETNTIIKNSNKQVLLFGFTPLVGDSLNIKEIDYKIIKAVNIEEQMFEVTLAAKVRDFDTIEYVYHKRFPSEIKDYIDNKSQLLYISICYGSEGTNYAVMPVPGWWRIRMIHHNRYFAEVLMPRLNYISCTANF